MKKALILIGVLIILVLGVVYFWPQKSVAPGPAGNINNNEAVDTTAGWLSYVNDSYGLLIKYPQDYLLTEGASTQYNAGEFFSGSGQARLPAPEAAGNGGQAVVTVGLPENSYAGTNFFDGFVTVSVQTEGANFDNCQNWQTDGDERVNQMTDGETIDSLIFYRADTGGAAAGTFSKTKIYHTFTNGICYEATLNLFQGNIGNYTPGTVEQVNEDEVFAKLQQVLETLEISSRTMF